MQRFRNMSAFRRLAHITNPVRVGRSSDLFVAQPITFETMRIAQEFSDGHVDVTLFCAQYPEDRSFVPDCLELTPDLSRSILDLGAFQTGRKLPLIKDILDRLYEASAHAEYLIYTNVDIALMPHFYLAVNNIIDSGYDAFVINRRTIPEAYDNLKDIPLMYAEVGKPHNGSDCFVFKRSVYPNYNLGTACIGADWIGKVLVTNLVCNATAFRVFDDVHLTFHIGDNRSWRIPEYGQCDEHNKHELLRIIRYYQAQNKVPEGRLIDSFLYKIENRGNNRSRIRILFDWKAFNRRIISRLRMK